MNVDVLSYTVTLGVPGGCREPPRETYEILRVATAPRLHSPYVIHERGSPRVSPL